MILDATVAFGLLAALTWGSGDFGGGLAARRGPILGIVLASQVVGAAAAAILFVIRGEPLPVPADVGWAVVGGLTGGLGITALYQGLATGRMGVVAPISGVLAAAIPVAVGLAIHGAPSTGRLAGFAFALVAVVLVSRAPDGRGGRSDVLLGLAAGVGIGLFNVAVSRFSPGAVFGPLAVTRVWEGILLGLVVLAVRRPWRLGAPALRLIVPVGLLDMAGNGFFILAAQAGRLDVAAILSSLYPVTTIVLAAIVLRERIVGAHLLGVLSAAVAIVLIGAG